MRRSTIGVRVRNSHGIQAASRSAARTNNTSVDSLVQPHWPPLVSGSRKLTKASDRTTPPTPSKAPGVRTLDSGTTSRTATNMAAAIPADTQNSACQLVCA